MTIIPGSAHCQDPPDICQSRHYSSPDRGAKAAREPPPSAFVKTFACPFQLPFWLAVTERSLKTLGIDRVALLQRDFSNGGRACQSSFKAVRDNFFDSTSSHLQET